MAIKNNGTLWGWGNNAYGQLGLSDNNNRNTPTQIGTDTNWEETSLGAYSSIAIKQDGTLWSCGENSLGQLGNGSLISSNVLNRVGTDTNWKSISSGYYHSIASKIDGSLWAWGQNGAYELGDNTKIFRQTPVNISTDKWISFNADASNNFAVKSDGTLWSWGTTEFAREGGTEILVNPLFIPTQIGTDTNWSHVEDNNTDAVFGVKTNGEIIVMGINKFGELGLGHVNNQQGPIYFGNYCEKTVSITQNTLSKISLYPNPTSGILHLANAENLNIINITVTDLTGKTVITQNGNTPQLSVQQLPNGIYFVNITANTGTTNLKFIKE